MPTSHAAENLGKGLSGRGRSCFANRMAPALLCTAIAGGFILMCLGRDERIVLLPAFAALFVGLVLWTALWDLDGALPVFDAGVLFAIAVVLYTVVPLLQYWASGMGFTVLSDNRMYQYDPAPAELGSFSWRFVVHLVSFAAVYIMFRGRAVANWSRLEGPGKAARNAILVGFLFFVAVFAVIQILFGIRYAAPYSVLEESHLILQSMPLGVRQVLHYSQGIFFIFKLGLLIVVVGRWRIRLWRMVLYCWMAAEILFSILLMGARTEMVLTLLAAALVYHRLVKPLKMRVLLPAALVLLIGFSVLGFVRSTGIEFFHAGLADDPNLLSAANEFSVVFGTAYDIFQMNRSGGLTVPWQVYASDILALVPQQLLPFEKLSPSQWYLQMIGLQGTPVGYAFGVVSEGIIGLDWIELALRGALLGFILAMIHRWYVRRSMNYFVTLFYLWLSLKIYLSFRATGFHQAVLVAYEFIPAYLLMKYGPYVMRWNDRHRQPVDA